MKFSNFVGPGYDLRNFQYDCQVCSNFLVEVDESGVGKEGEVAQLVSRPGLAPVVTGLAGASRGGYYASNNTLYWVFGINLYRITVGSGLTGWSATSLGTVGGGTLPVFMTDNSTDLFILASGSIRIYNFSSGVITTASGGAYASASSMTFLDSYVIFSQTNSGRFFWTDLLSTSADTLNFATAEANPDRLVGMIANSQQLWLFGRKSAEVWYNYGQNNVVFARQSNLLIETGCVSQYTIKKIGQSVMWLGIDERGGPQVNVANGYNPTRVSTFAIEQKLNQYSFSALQQAVAESYNWNGHELYVINVPGADETWVYDFTSSKQLGKPCWTTMTSSDGNGALSRHRGQGVVAFSGYHISGDFEDGTLYVMDKDTFTDDGNYIVWERTTPQISAEDVRLFHDEMKLYFLTGATSNLTLDPQVMMQYSNDGGATWSDERWQSCGKTGEYSLKVEFRRMGSARSRVYRIRMSDQIYWAISGAAIEMRKGSH